MLSRLGRPGRPLLRRPSLEELDPVVDGRLGRRRRVRKGGHVADARIAEDEKERVPSRGDIDSHQCAQHNEGGSGVEHSSPRDLEVWGEFLLASRDVDVVRTYDEAEERG